MSSPASAPPWQPLTFGGVAAFAGGTLTRVLLLQIIASGLVGGAVVWFLILTCFPVLDTAVARLPDQAGVRQGRLDWPGPSPVVLGETPAVALAVNATESRSPGTTADLEILLTPQGVRFSSLLGHRTIPYLKGWRMEVSRKAAESWWAAWRRAVVVGLWVVGGVGLMVLTSGLALVMAVPVRLVGRILRRSQTTLGSWQLAVAASYPAQLLGVAALILYGYGRLSLPGLTLAAVFQVVILILYLVSAPWQLPRLGEEARGKNPFAGKGGGWRGSRKGRNPFA